MRALLTHHPVRPRRRSGCLLGAAAALALGAAPQDSAWKPPGVMLSADECLSYEEERAMWQTRDEMRETRGEAFIDAGCARSEDLVGVCESGMLARYFYLRDTFFVSPSHARRVCETTHGGQWRRAWTADAVRSWAEAAAARCARPDAAPLAWFEAAVCHAEAAWGVAAEPDAESSWSELDAAGKAAVEAVTAPPSAALCARAAEVAKGDGNRLDEILRDGAMHARAAPEARKLALAVIQRCAAPR